MTSYSDYTAYFEQLAMQLLGHREDEKHFYRRGLAEYLRGLQTDVNYPCLLLEKYDFNYNENGSDNVFKSRSIAFIIVDHSMDKEDYNRIDTIYDFTEEIIDKIVNQIRKDMRYPKHNFLKYFNINSVQATPVNNDTDNSFGYFVSMELASTHSTKL